VCVGVIETGGDGTDDDDDDGSDEDAFGDGMPPNTALPVCKAATAAFADVILFVVITGEVAVDWLGDITVKGVRGDNDNADDDDDVVDDTDVDAGLPILLPTPLPILLSTPLPPLRKLTSNCK
jgi:hypothetical protein